MAATGKLSDVVGRRGELITHQLLTDYVTFKQPLFEVNFLGDKWPGVDFYVELRSTTKRKAYFFIQAKSTNKRLSRRRPALNISAKKKATTALLKLPGPTYMFGIHEPSGRIFVKAVYLSTPPKAIASIPFRNELTVNRLRELYDEVRSFWRGIAHKPATSIFP